MKTGFRRAYIALHFVWVITLFSLYLLDWPGAVENDPREKTWLDNLYACQSHARSYDVEERHNTFERQLRHVQSEIPNFGRDRNGIQITTLEGALKECELRYPPPTAVWGFWRGVFRDMRHSSEPVDRAFRVTILFFVPTIAYLLLYSLSLAVVSGLRWIRRGFETSTGS